MASVSIKFFVIFAKLLGGVFLASVAFGSVMVLLYCLSLFYLFYRLIWLFSIDGIILRMKRKFRCHKEKICLEGLRRRAALSRTADQKNMKHLIILVNDAMNLRKAYVNPAIITEIQSILTRCRYAKDFKQVLHIHQVVANTDIASLNSSLEELLDEG